MAAIAHIDKGMFRFSGNPLNLVQSIGQGVTIIWITVNAKAPTNQPPLDVAATLTLQPNSYRLWALPLLMHSTSGACTLQTFFIMPLLCKNAGAGLY
jgi:hypothetical protein